MFGMEASPVDASSDDDLDPWNPEIYGLGDHLSDCFCWYLSTLVKLVFWRGVTLLQVTYPSIEARPRTCR